MTVTTNNVASKAQSKARELRDAADETNAKITDLAFRAGETVRDFMDERREQAVQAADEVAGRIREHPLRSGLIALGAGYVLGRLFSR